MLFWPDVLAKERLRVESADSPHCGRCGSTASVAMVGEKWVLSKGDGTRMRWCVVVSLNSGVQGCFRTADDVKDNLGKLCVWGLDSCSFICT